MIDFHAHILPNIDDGSKSIEETFNLIKEAQQAGFDTIVSTSHYMEGYYEVENKERRIWIDALNEKLKEQNINVQLYLGNEIYITENIINLLENDKASSINNSNYVLFEMPLNVEPLNLNDVLFEMLRCKIIPVLAHPERYAFVQKNPDMLYELAEKGILMQCNFGSFIGQYGTKAEIIAKELLLKDMVQFLGTDVHKQETVYPNMPKIMSALNKLVGEEKVKQITEINPMLAMNNKKFDVAEPKHIKISLKDILKMNLRK